MRVYKPKGEHDDDFADLYPDVFDAEPKTRRRKAAPDNVDDVDADADNDNDDYDGYLDDLTDPDDDEPYFED
jgi:hypothetical protein